MVSEGESRRTLIGEGRRGGTEGRSDTDARWRGAGRAGQRDGAGAAGSLNTLHNHCHAVYKRGEFMCDNFIITHAAPWCVRSAS